MENRPIPNAMAHDLMELTKQDKKLARMFCYLFIGFFSSETDYWKEVDQCLEDGNY